MGQIEGDPAVKPASKLGTRGVALAVGVPFAVVGIGLVALMATGGGDGNPEGSVIKACQDAVKDRLKAPSTADFQTGARESKPGIWTVVGSVDAQNSFGAQVRTDFTCTITWYAPDKSATVAGITIQP